MDIPGLTGVMDDPHFREKAEKEAERLLEDLKREVKAESRDIGTLRKEIRITIPEKVIADHMAHNYDELRQDAIVPGFRKGRAPLRLIEKRFGSEVRASLTTSLVGQSFFAVVDNEKLQVLGDPVFRVEAGAGGSEGTKLVEFDEALEHLKLPARGDMTYTCEVEVKPTFELPELKGIPIRPPQVEITDAMVEEQIERQCKNLGRYEPLTGEAARENDLVIADTWLRVEGQEIKHEDNVQLAVRPCRVDNIPFLTLDKDLAGVKPGQTRKVACQIPDDYERSDVRGKSGELELRVHELKRLAPVSIETVVQHAGAESEQQLREFIREDLDARSAEMAANSRREQVLDYLLEHTQLELPAALSARQTTRAVARHVVELQSLGIPASDIEQKIDELTTSARADATRDLKLGFIMEQVAEKLGVNVTDEEVNSEIARIARRYNRRFDRIRDDLAKRGLLDQVSESIRDNKAVRLLLDEAQVLDTPAPDTAAPEKPQKSAKK